MTTIQELTDEQLMKAIIQAQDIIANALQIQPQLAQMRKELSDRENKKEIVAEKKEESTI